MRAEAKGKSEKEIDGDQVGRRKRLPDKPAVGYIPERGAQMRAALSSEGPGCL